MVLTNEMGSLAAHNMCDLFNDCDGGSPLQFWFAFTSKLHSMIIKFKTSSELVAVGRDCCKHVNDEELITVFAEVESLLNFPSVDLSEFRSTRRCSIDP